MGNIVEAATLGIIDDPFGTEAAQASAEQGQRESIASQERMFQQSMDFQRELWDWQRGQMEPWRQAGLGALPQFQEQINRGFQFDLQSDPLYAARLSEMDRNLGISQAARGMKLSGSTLKGLRDITASELSGAYGRQFNEYQQNLANIGNLVNLGLGSTTNLTNIGQQYGQTVTGLQQGFGQAQSQYYQNMGAIGAQAAVAPFQNLMSLGSTVGGLMMGYGALR